MASKSAIHRESSESVYQESALSKKGVRLQLPGFDILTSLNSFNRGMLCLQGQHSASGLEPDPDQGQHIIF